MEEDYDDYKRTKKLQIEMNKKTIKGWMVISSKNPEAIFVHDVKGTTTASLLIWPYILKPTEDMYEKHFADKKLLNDIDVVKCEISYKS